MPLADWQICQAVDSVSLLTPFASIKQGSPSYGLQPFGYDIRLGRRFVFLDHPIPPQGYVSPNNKDPEQAANLRVVEAEESLLLLPGEFVLAHSVEYFRMPSWLTGEVKDKSTYARLGIAIQNTVIEAGWCGQLTLELSNHGPLPVALLCGLGIAQILFEGSPHVTAERPYDGKYQYQTGVTPSKA